METYVRFIDTKVIPLEQLFDARDSVRDKVAFDDLAYLFREGEHVYCPLPSNRRVPDGVARDPTSSSPMSTTWQSFWRVCSIFVPQHSEDPDDDAAAGIKREGQRERRTYHHPDLQDDYEDIHTPPADSVSIDSYFIDFNGDSYLPSRERFTIKKYGGEVFIATLRIYPIRYLKSSSSYDLVARQEKLGQGFMDIVSQRDVYHFGWTVNHQPNGSRIENTGRHSEFIDGEMIIDFQEG